MTTREQALILVRKAKADLKTETDPDKRHRIAIRGEEMNILAHQLKSDKPVRLKWCKKGKHLARINKFSKATGTHSYKKKDGTIVNYTKEYMRGSCNACLWSKDTGHNF